MVWIRFARPPLFSITKREQAINWRLARAYGTILGGMERRYRVSETNRDALQATWRRLAQRYDWRLVDDEAGFLDRVAAEYATLREDVTAGRRQYTAVKRAYSTLLYRGLWGREERAATELWLAFMRTALGRGDTRPEAEEWAQEAIACVIEKLPSLRSPQSLLFWAFTIFRTVQRESRKWSKAEQSFQDDDDGRPYEAPDPVDLAALVEQDLADQDLLRLLAAHLLNDLERLVLLRIGVFGDHPRDVAADLGLPLHRTRLAKSRALKRLREDETFMRMLRDLVGAAGQQPATTGANDDAS